MVCCLEEDFFGRVVLGDGLLANTLGRERFWQAGGLFGRPNGFRPSNFSDKPNRAAKPIEWFWYVLGESAYSLRIFLALGLAKIGQ